MKLIKQLTMNNMSTFHKCKCILCLVKQEQDHRSDVDSDLLTEFSNILFALGNFTPQ